MRYFVSEPSVPMYLCPDGKSEVTDELLYGTSVTLQDESYGGYVFCKTEYGYSGYVDTENVSPKKKEGTKFIVTSTFCDLYAYPEYRFAPLLTLPRGSVIEGNEKASPEPRFLGIEHEGKICYVPRKNVSSAKSLSNCENSDEKRAQIVRTAMSYLGTPYRWGGKTPHGIDCSGLCFMAYTLCGLSLYRDAEPDARYVRKIPFETLEPADLIYYNGHITMYIGGGRYIHSSATLGGVTFGSFDKNSPHFYPALSADIVCCARNHYFGGTGNMELGIRN